MKPQNAVLNRIHLNVFNWVHVIAIECDNEDKLVMHFDSGYSKTFTDKPTIRAIIDLIQIFPDIMHEPTREKMKQVTLMNNPMNMNSDRLKQDDVNAIMPEDLDEHFKRQLAKNPELKQRYEEAQRHTERMKAMQSRSVK